MHTATAVLIATLAVSGIAMAHGGWGPGGPHGRGPGPWWARQGAPPPGYWYEPMPDPGVDPSEVPADSTQRGAQLYRTYCATCHGPYARGGGRAPDLMALVPQRDDGYLARVIRQGRGGMPAWGGVLDGDAIGDLIAYLRREAEAARPR